MSYPVTQKPSPARLLVVRLGAMGDVLHTLPAVELLHRAWPESHITWAVEPRWAPLLEGHPGFEVFPAPVQRWTRDWSAPQSWKQAHLAIRELRDRRFDLAVVFHSLIKATVLARLAGPREVVGFDTANLREPISRFLLNRQITANREHVVDKNLALVRGLTGMLEEASAPPRLPAGEASTSLPVDDFLLASPVAGWTSKQWPPEFFARLAALAWEQRGLPLVLDGAPGDRQTLQSIAAQAPPGACVPHVSSIAQLLAATRRASAVVGVDSGPLHLADALGKPGVALFGPTDPNRNGPRGKSLAALRRADAQTTYRRETEIAASMRAISPEEVWSELASKLNSRPTLSVVGAPKEDESS